MNKYQKALECIEHIVIDEQADGYHQPRTVADYYGVEILMLQELVNKTTPKKVLELHYEEEGEPPYIKRVCPNGCRVQIYPITKNYKGHEQRYCHRCGQKIHSEYLDDELEITDEEWERWNR